MFQAGPALEWHQKEEEYELELVTQEGRNNRPLPLYQSLGMPGGSVWCDPKQVLLPWGETRGFFCQSAQL